MNAQLSRFFLFLYAGVWLLARPWLARHKRLRSGFATRLVPAGWPFAPALPPPPGPCLWVQAASGGEAWLVHSLVAALPETLPETLQGALPPGQSLSLVCTTCTSQGLDILQQLPSFLPLPEGGEIRLFPCYFPLDQPGLMQKAVQAIQPTAILLLETELWPGLLAAAKAAHVPVLVGNARMTPKSHNLYRWLRPFWQSHSPACVLAISKEDAARFASLFPSATVGTMPNSKFDRVAQPAPLSSHPLPPQPFASEQAQPILAFASVRQEEETLLLPLFRHWQYSVHGQPALLALAPRHLHRVPFWCQALEDAGFQVLLRSQMGKGAPSKVPGSQPLALLWDTFGELHALYNMADAVFVGGSLAPLGGQNFLEPLALGLCPCIGPFWSNFSWVGLELFTKELACQVAGPEYLLPALLAQAQAGLGADTTAWQQEREAKKHAIRQAFSAWVAPKQGGSLQLAKAILALGKKNS